MIMLDSNRGWGGQVILQMYTRSLHDCLCDHQKEQIMDGLTLIRQRML
jgi:hypothetical protein